MHARFGVGMALLFWLVLGLSACGGGASESTPAIDGDGETQADGDNQDGDTVDGDTDTAENTDGDSTENDAELEEGQICDPQSRSCYGNSVFICDDKGTGYLRPEDCGSSKFCKDGVCLDQLCEPDSLVCADTNSYKTCLSNGGGYSEPLTCGAHRYCKLGACFDEVCTPKAKGCIGNSYAACADDGSGWGAATACGAGTFCDEGECKNQVCTPNAWRCQGNAAHEQCKADGSGYGDPEICGLDQYCVNGACQDQICTPSQARCAEGQNAVETCDELGAHWSEPLACASDKLCNSGVCTSKTCEPKSTVCGGDSVLTCLDNGQGYGTAVPCGANKYCDAGQCKNQVCTPSATSCNADGEKETCNANGSNATSESCGAAHFCKEGLCYNAVCDPNSATCETVTARKVCKADGSGYGEPSSCQAEQVCVDGACTARACAPDTMSCQGNSVVVCNANGTGYNTPTPCGDGNYCKDGVCHSQACTPNLAECRGNSFVVCSPSGSAFGDPQPCGSSQYCLDGQCHDQACTPNLLACADDFHYHTCTNNGAAWGDSYACPNAQYCDAGSCRAQACTPGVGECLTATTYRVCNAKGSAYDPDKTCVGNYICDAGDCHNPNEIPDPTIDVAFVRPQPGATVELTQGDSLNFLINAVASGLTIGSVELWQDNTRIQIDNELPYAFDFTVPANAPTGTIYTFKSRAIASNGRFNTSQPAFIKVRNDPPLATFTATVSGDKQVALDASPSTDRETATADLDVRWDFDNDGTFDTDWSKTKVVEHTYPGYGTYTIGLEVRDNVGQRNFITQQVSFADVTFASGDITATTTWYGMIKITGTVFVKSGATLNIAEGTNVLFVYQDTMPADGVGDYSIIVESGGNLVVSGTASKPVLISSYGVDTRRPGAWGKIQLVNGASSSLTHAIIEYGLTCLDITDSTDLTNVEIRSCKTAGVRLSSTAASGNTFADVEIHHGQGVGLLMESGAKNAVITDLSVHDNATFGARLTGGATAALTGGDAYANTLDGFRIESSTPAISDFTIRENGRTGLYYSGTLGGTLTHSTITANAAEGVRIENQNTSPTITYNNINGNSVTGGTRLTYTNPSATLSFSGSAYLTTRTSGVWSAPNNGIIRRVNIAYSETDNSYYNYVSGGIYKNGSSSALWNVSTNTSGTWADISDANANAIKLFVYDSGYSSSATHSISANELVYWTTGAGVEMSAYVLNTTVNAGYNYWGVFPNALGAVSMSGATAVNMEGFVGVPFDNTWTTGNYVAGTIAANRTLTGEVFITGDVTVNSGVTLTLNPGAQIKFVKHDQNSDFVGDFSITVKGVLTALGTTANPITIDGTGDTPEDNAYEFISLEGDGSVLDHLQIARGKTALRISGASAVLRNSEIAKAGDIGLALVNTKNGTSIEHVKIQEAGGNGLVMAGGSASLSYVQSLKNGLNGLFLNAASGSLTATDCTFRTNTASGVSAYGPSTLTMSYSHLGDNRGSGAESAGAVGGSITYANVSFNKQQGLYFYRRSNALPTLAVNTSNIYSNAVDKAYQVDLADTSSTLSVSGSAYLTTRTSSTYTVPSSGKALYAKMSYTETDNSYYNYVSGGITDGAGTQLWTISTNVSNTWVDLTSSSPSSLKVFIYDSGYSSSATHSIVASSVISGRSVTGTDIEVTAINTGSETLNMKNNWWGGSLNPAGLISQAPTSLVDYSGFTGNTYVVGPR